MTAGQVSVSVDANYCGRIKSLVFLGTNLLVWTGNDLTSGSTFWQSPQSAWSGGTWPPAYNLDNGGSWQASFTNNSNALVLSSYSDSGNKVSLRKILTGNPESNTITFTYGIKNDDSIARSWAPWEITRVSKEGMIFFPKGTSITNPASAFTPNTESNAVWIQNTSLSDKLYRDGAEAWMGYVTNGLLFVKKWDSDISTNQFAPTESEVEVYAAGGYFEIENQGAYTSIPAGGWLNWSVTWRVTNIPGTVTVAVGSQTLLDFARQLAQ